jgi:hypothetical protein
MKIFSWNGDYQIQKDTEERCGKYLFSKQFITFQLFKFLFLRLSASNFDWLLENIRPMIEKQDTALRKSITADKRLAITLKFLATGESFFSLSTQFVIGESTVGVVVKETCRAIIRALRSFLQAPNTKEEWRAIADQFYSKWDYPNALGALDGKHVHIQKPANSGSRYFNYKSTFSIVLMGLVDANGW